MDKLGIYMEYPGPAYLFISPPSQGLSWSTSVAQLPINCWCLYLVIFLVVVLINYVIVLHLACTSPRFLLLVKCREVHDSFSDKNKSMIFKYKFELKLNFQYTIKNSSLKHWDFQRHSMNCSAKCLFFRHCQLAGEISSIDHKLLQIKPLIVCQMLTNMFQRTCWHFHNSSYGLSNRKSGQNVTQF